MSIDRAMVAHAILMRDQSTPLIRGKSVFSPTDEVGSGVVYIKFQTWAGPKFRKMEKREISNALLRRKRKPLPTDLQSGIIQRSSAACEQAAYAIQSAHKHLSPEEALRTIGTIWESLDNAERFLWKSPCDHAKEERQQVSVLSLRQSGHRQNP